MSNVTLITFIVYLLGLLFIGIISYRLTSNLSDYVLGGRKLGPGVTALSAGASDMSSWLLLGLPGVIYASGLAEAWIAVGLSFGAYLNWQFVAKRLRVYTEVANNSITIPDFLENRFRDKSHVLRIISALVILLFFTFYTSAGMVGGAKLFEASFGLTYSEALWTGAIVIVSYTFLGGFLAVSWTDFIQGILMFLALIIVPIRAILITGGWEATIDAVGNISPDHINMLAGVGVIGIISSLAWGLGYFGQPHILTRFMALRSAQDVPKARFIGMTWMILGLYGAIFVGLSGLAFISTQDIGILSDFGIQVTTNDAGIQMLADPEKIFIAFSQVLFDPVIAGILLAAILSAIMSTIDSQLLVSSSAVAEDFYKAIFRKHATQKELVWVSRVAVITIALIATLLATNPENSVLDLVSYAWAGFGGAFGPILILSLFWKKITRNGALAGIIVGAITVIIWGDFLTAEIAEIFGMYEIVPAFFLNFIVAILVSQFGAKPNNSIQTEFDEVIRKL